MDSTRRERWNVIWWPHVCSEPHQYSPGFSQLYLTQSICFDSTHNYRAGIRVIKLVLPRGGEGRLNWFYPERVYTVEYTLYAHITCLMYTCNVGIHHGYTTTQASPHLPTHPCLIYMPYLSLIKEWTQGWIRRILRTW